MQPEGRAWSQIGDGDDEADTLTFLRRHVGKSGIFIITEVKKYEGKD